MTISAEIDCENGTDEILLILLKNGLADNLMINEIHVN